MKVLWLINIMLPDVAAKLGMKSTNKEGWLSGTVNTVRKCHDFELAIAFPIDMEHAPYRETLDGITYYGFYEDTFHPEVYSTYLEDALKGIVEDYKPDVVHIYGTEFPHTLAMSRVMENEPEKMLIGIQGVLDIYKDHFFDGVPARVINRKTFRDKVKKDSLVEQQDKFARRAVSEIEALKKTGNVTGRTSFDRIFTERVAPLARYHFMNETLRPEFYEGSWNYDSCERHSIFLSQGNYPIKGLHFVLEALPSLVEKYEDIKIYVAGDNVTKHSNLKEKLKLASYDKYLVELLKKNKLEDRVIFTGSLDAKGIKERLLKSNVFLCPSTIENSPNSLGEAMMLGVPSVSSDVGGISSIFVNGADGILYKCGDNQAMIDAICTMFDDLERAKRYSGHASTHAKITHNPSANYNRLLEIYKEICSK